MIGLVGFTHCQTLLSEPSQVNIVARRCLPANGAAQQVRLLHAVGHTTLWLTLGPPLGANGR